MAVNLGKFTDPVPDSGTSKPLGDMSDAGVQRDHQAGSESTQEEMLRYKQIVSASRDFLAFVDRNYRYRAVNDVYVRSFQRPRDQIIGRTIGEILGEKRFQEGVRQYFDRCLAGESVDFSLVIETPEQGQRQMRVHYDPYRDQDGRVQGVVLVSRDVTDVVRIEQELRDSERRYKALYHDNPSMNFTLTPAGDILSINRFGAARLGYSMDELIGKSITVLVQDEDRMQLLGYLHRCTESPGEQREWDIGMRDRDGAAKWMKVTARALPAEGGDLQILLVSRDITERKAAEAEAARMKQQYEMVLSTASEGIYGLDKHGSVTFINRAAEAILGWRSMEIIGLEMHKHVHYAKADGQPRPPEESPILISLATGTVQHSDDDIFWRRDGGPMPVEYTSTPVWDNDRIVGAVVTFHDITERVTNQRLLGASRERLRNLAERLYSLREQERTSIAREIHDVFGQELTALKIDLAWTRKQLSGADDSLKDRIDQMIRIVDEMVSQTRTISARLRPAVLDDLGLEAAIESLVDDFQSRTGWTCTFAPDAEDLPPNAPRDTAVYRIVQEALTNAARHAEATSVEITLKLKGNVLEARVADNGIGISNETIQDTKSLGLFGMRERAGAFGGRVEICGTRGMGTTITLTLPVEAVT